jgi:hypothetical protein
MVEIALMAKDKTFNLRLDDLDRKRLDRIAQELSAPAATAVRILIKKEYDQLVASETRADARRWHGFADEIESMIRLSEVPNLKATFEKDEHRAHLTDGKRKRTIELADEAFVEINRWPGSRLDCNKDGRMYNDRTGLGTDGQRVAEPSRPTKKT